MTRNQIQNEILRIMHGILNELIAYDGDSQENLIQLRYDLMTLIGLIDPIGDKGILPRKEKNT